MKHNSQQQNAPWSWPTLLAERQPAAPSLRESEALFRNLIEGSIQGIFIYRPGGRLLFVNQTCADIFGYATPEEFVAMASIEALIDLEEIDHWRAYQEALLRGEEALVRYEFNAIRKDRAIVTLQSDVRVLSWDGDPAIQLTIIDATDCKRAKNALAEYEEKLRAITAATQDAIILIDVEGRVDFWNPGAQSMFGYTAEEALGRELAEMIVPEGDRDQYRAALARFTSASPGAVAGATTVTVLRQKGTPFPVELSISPTTVRGKRGAIGIVKDITDRRRIEAKNQQDLEFQIAISGILKVSLKPISLEEKLAQILDLVLSVPGISIQSKGAIFLSDEADNLVLVAHKGLDEPVLELCAKVPFGDCLCGRAAQSGELVYTNHLDERHSIRYPGMKPHGHYCMPIFSGTDRVLGVLNTYIDECHVQDSDDESFLSMMGFLSVIATPLAGVIEHHRMEEKYHSLSRAVEQSPASVVITNTAGNIEYVNSKFLQITGYNTDEVLGKNPRILKSDHTKPEEYRALWETITGGREWRGELHNRKKNGEMFIELASISPIRAADGSITQFLAVKEDITERKALESQLAHAQKMESIGQLAAGIAHEINTPTQYVSDNLRFLEEALSDIARLLETYEALEHQMPEGAVDASLLTALEQLKEELDVDYLRQELTQSIGQALEGVAQVSRIVQAMKQFAHPGSQEKTPADLNKAIESTLTVARNEWKYVADVELELDPTLPPVPCLLGDINQAVLNMIINAAHAIQEKLGKTPEGKGTITVSTYTEHGEAVIRIRDTGVGIPEEIRSKIFDPFFTTKGVGKGTGQGLAISYSVVVDKHGGRLTCDSTQGKGTTFCVYLPLNNANSELI